MQVALVSGHHVVNIYLNYRHLLVSNVTDWEHVYGKKDTGFLYVKTTLPK
jgi:hypothetical protein